MVASSDRSAVAFSLTPGNAHDAPEGRALLETFERADGVMLLMDRAYEGDSTREKAVEKGFVPVVPPKKNRREPWEYDKELYKRRNEIERLFLRLKRFRKVFTRYDKLDVLYMGFIFVALIVDALLSVNTL
jgi:transposase